ncbi:MAG: hypothetical protein ACMUEM_06915 [Flavobacteriales bacterium AspAUS03]
MKLCLSGHIHYIDTVDYLSVKYLYGGGVLSNWWRGELSKSPMSIA